MKILALESSAKAASAAICEGDAVLALYYQNCGLTHSATLMPMAEAALRNCGLELEDIGLVAVALGPGSFTGLRIGVAAAKGLAWGAGLPCCGVSTLEAMAWQLAFTEADICCVMDARRNQVYSAYFRCSGGRPERLCADRALGLDALCEELKCLEKPHFLVGDGADLCYSYLKGKNVEVLLPPPHLKYQSAYGVAMAAASARPVSPDELNPVYIRLPQAERERLEREEAAGRGLPPQ